MGEVAEAGEVRPSLFVRSCGWAGRLLGTRWGRDERLEESLRFLGWGVGGGEVKALALLLSLLFSLFLLPLLLLSWRFLFLLFLSPLVYLGVSGYPLQAAEGEKRRRVGEVPRLLCALSSSLLLHPNPEVAGEFAAENAGGRMGPELGKELSRVFLRVYREAGEALRGFSRRWGDPPELSGPLHLLLASVRMEGEDRRRAVERALEGSLEGVRGRVREFVEWVRFPLLLLYSFGILLPLCLLTLLPVLGSLGLLSAPLLLAFYGFLLPLVLYLLSSWILSKRPSVSHSPELRREGKPLLTLPLFPLLLLGLLLLSSPELRVLVLLWSVVLPLSLHLFLTSRRVERCLEDELPDILQELGSELRGGRPWEGALRRVAEDRALAWIPLQAPPRIPSSASGKPSEPSVEFSGLVRGTLSLLADLARRSERAAGEAALQLSSHLRRLKEVERRGREEMAEVFSSMRSVALFFSPLLTSLTCQMYAVLWERGFSGSLSPALLLLLLGFYQLILSLFLLSLVSEMEGGRRKRLLLASGLPLSLLVFTLGAVGGGALLSWLT